MLTNTFFYLNLYTWKYLKNTNCIRLSIIIIFKFINKKKI